MRTLKTLITVTTSLFLAAFTTTLAVAESIVLQDTAQQSLLNQYLTSATDPTVKTDPVSTQPSADVTPQPVALSADVTPQPDANHDGIIDVNDLLVAISQWGSCSSFRASACFADVNGDNQVNELDLMAILSHWS